jgi:hypothetical protein
MIRTVWFALLLVVPAIGADGDPVEVFRSCAYTPVLPSRTGTASLVSVKIDTGADQGSFLEQAKPGEHFYVSVTAQFNGYLYLFQDPPDPTTLIFPEPKAPSYQLKKGVAWTQRYKFIDAKATTLLVAVTPTPLPDASKLTAAQVRQLFQPRAKCGVYYLYEKKF